MFRVSSQRDVGDKSSSSLVVVFLGFQTVRHVSRKLLKSTFPCKVREKCLSFQMIIRQDLHILTVLSSSSCEQLSSLHSYLTSLSICDVYCLWMSFQEGVKALPTLTVNKGWNWASLIPSNTNRGLSVLGASETLITTPASMSQTLPRSVTKHVRGSLGQPQTNILFRAQWSCFLLLF